MGKQYAQASAQVVYLCRIQRRDARLYVQLDLLSLPHAIVLLVALETHRHLDIRVFAIIAV